MLYKIVRLERSNGLDRFYAVISPGDVRPYSAEKTRAEYAIGDFVSCKVHKGLNSIEILEKANYQHLCAEIDFLNQGFGRLRSSNWMLSNSLEDIKRAFGEEYEKNKGNGRVAAAFGLWRGVLSVGDSVESERCTQLIQSMSRLFLKKLESQKALSQKAKDEMLLHAFAKEDWIQAVFFLLSGANVNQHDEIGSTLLMKNIVAKRYNIAEFLIAAGACPVVANKKGISALSVAKERGDKVALLLFENAPSYTRNSAIVSAHNRRSRSNIDCLTDVPEGEAQNQDEIVQKSASVEDATSIQDQSKDQHDGSKDWGFMARDQGGFGSYPLVDDYGDESSP